MSLLSNRAIRLLRPFKDFGNYIEVDTKTCEVSTRGGYILEFGYDYIFFIKELGGATQFFEEDGTMFYQGIFQ
jgi:hypothetical protein